MRVPGIGQTGTPGADIPLLPLWFRQGGWFPIGIVLLVLSSLIAEVGHAHGDTAGWFLFLLLLTACAAAWSLDYKRRLDNARAAFRLGLVVQSRLEAVDAMTGHQFEFYYASLLRALEWTEIEVIGDRAGGDGGADILATDPRGRRFAIQCKRYMLPRKVDIDGPRRLNGSLAHEHPHRFGLIVTSSELTQPARTLASKSGIYVIERDELAAQMARITDEAAQRNNNLAARSQ